MSDGQAGAAAGSVPVGRGDVWSTVGDGLLLVVRVDELAALATVTGVAVALRRPAVGPPLAVPLGAESPTAWARTTLVVTVPRGDLVARCGRVGPRSMAAVADALTEVLGLGRLAGDAGVGAVPVP